VRRGVGRKVIGVASMDNSHVELRTFTVTTDGTAIGYTNAAAAPPAPTSGSATMSKVGTPASTADGCDSTGGTCFGDSGGPVYQRGMHTILSVTSFGLNPNCKGLDFSYRIDRPDVLAWIAANSR
jgi:secreted trypsin-like serine protease